MINLHEIVRARYSDCYVSGEMRLEKSFFYDIHNTELKIIQHNCLMNVLKVEAYNL